MRAATTALLTRDAIHICFAQAVSQSAGLTNAQVSCQGSEVCWLSCNGNEKMLLRWCVLAYSTARRLFKARSQSFLLIASLLSSIAEAQKTKSRALRWRPSPKRCVRGSSRSTRSVDQKAQLEASLYWPRAVRTHLQS